MAENEDVRFVTSSIKLPRFSVQHFVGPSLNPPICRHSISSNLRRCRDSVRNFLTSISRRMNANRLATKSSLLCSSSLGLSHSEETSASLSSVRDIQQKGLPSSRHGKEDEERVLISEVLVRNKDGEELERKDLEAEALAALKASRANSALTVREVQEDVHRIIDSGHFYSCMPVAVDTRDGIRLVFQGLVVEVRPHCQFAEDHGVSAMDYVQMNGDVCHPKHHLTCTASFTGAFFDKCVKLQVEPNQEFQGVVCEGADVLPAKVLEDLFHDGYGKTINIRRLDEVINSINGWYMDRGLFGLVSDVEILSGGILHLKVSEAEVNSISIRFFDRRSGEPTTGKTRPETILRQLTTKKGQVYSLLQGKRDVETILRMGIMEDVSIIPQPAGDTGKVDLVMNCVERVSGGFSAGGGISSGITSGPLSGLIGSFNYSHRNVFGRNKKLNLSLERGQIDSIFRINYTDPWIEGDDKRTSRSIMVQNSRTPGMLVHGTQTGQGTVTIGRVMAGIEYSRPLTPKWSGTAGIIFQHAGACDENGKPIIKDFYGSPLTSSGNANDDMLIAKLESVYTGSGDHGSSVFVFNMEQGLPVFPEWLCFNRMTARARRGIEIGPGRLFLSLSGGQVVGNFSPHEAFALGGTNSVRGYEEGAVGSGRSFLVGCAEISLRLFGPVEGAVFADYGSDLGSGQLVPGDPAGARGKPGSGYGYGAGIRVDSPLGPLRLEYAFNDRHAKRFHFGVGLRN